MKILMEEKDRGLYERIGKNTRQIADTVKDTFGSRVRVNQIGSLMSVFFTDKPVVDFETAAGSDTEQYADYFNYMLGKGIYLAPSQFEAMFVSNAHSKEDLEKTCQAIKEYSGR